MNREQWLDERKKGISGTGASAIMGCNKYMTNAEYWELKTGKREEEDIGDEDCVQYGLDAENLLIELFKLDYPEYEVKHKEFDLRIHPEYDFIIGSLDGELTEKKTGRKGILEIKTTEIKSRSQEEEWKDGIPHNYFYQTLHYLLVTGYEFVVLKVQKKYIREDDVYLETKHYYYERKDVEHLIKDLLEREIYFWKNYVLTNKRPPLLIAN